VPRIQAIDPRSQATVVILVEGLLAMANLDTVVILNLQAVATRNRKTIPTTLNTIRANTPSKPVPERQCPLSDTLTLLSTFLTEQDDEEHDQPHLRLPGLISRYSSPRQIGGFPHNRTHVSVTCPAQRLGLSGLFEISIVNLLLVPHAPRIVAHIVSTWLLSFW
jgi:hypothetical protein